ncbi:amylo-alpha-1,6-glucosidase [Brachybacterium endophyticum]|uniref:Amylo-alpha-1,6-glucosidase n=1 Tax=Brachybacterium endophyticum TaxID=2182385 RepID=A0A2U2RNP8_9MICO|nr:glycogen debranching N-terminal domain-containing protein [Brachybacterium endophyticum]PWH07374.1 amylo-alpha-1,6-glucosidase [Brachybacterium endophyticum]
MSTARVPDPSAALGTERHRESHQPFLHDLTAVLHAPIQVWSSADGEITGTGAQGVHIGDTRVVSDLRCTLAGAELTPLATSVVSARQVTFRHLVTSPGMVEDPLVILERTRSVGADGVHETLRLVNDDDRPHALHLGMGLVTDAATMSQVKDPRLLATQDPARPLTALDGGTVRWRFGEHGEAALRTGDGSAAGAPAGDGLSARGSSPDGPSVDGPVVTWDLALEAPAHDTATTTWRLDLSDPGVPFAPLREAASLTTTAMTPEASTPTNPDPEHRAVTDLLTRSLSDLDALRLQIPDDPSRHFLAAGAPWFFTLFGRDSLIAASLLLPVDRHVAEGTLRTLARHQGVRVDPETAEQPGKILHEVRAQGMELEGGHLPPVYYGTIDATPLWIELLHDGLAAGLDPVLLDELHAPLEAAATWLLEHADADGDGLLEYLDASGRGLANQGWKDSGDSIRCADGSLASGAIALAEVQGYAHAAALHAADLLEQAGDSDLPPRLRAVAARLREVFQAHFWCEDELGPYIALALDGEKRPVDGVASNMGHLLGTGILDAEQERTVVRRLMDPTLFSGFGIRTLSTTNGGYGPLRYHGGSVWTHDTGIILRGMLRSGFQAEAQVLARGLLRAASGFDQRLPELFGGQGSDEVEAPLPYPASCRPQAWAAASAVPIAQTLGVLDPPRPPHRLPYDRDTTRRRGGPR